MKPHPAGFTLVEILVVIAILSLLAAILLAVFGRVREKSRQASCQSNEKQILLAVHMYEQDNDGYFPMQYRFDPSPIPPLYAQIVTWYEVLVPYTKSQQVFQCPTDNGTAIGGNWSPAPKFRSSYAASNDLLQADDPLAAYGSASSSRVIKPSTTVFLCDAGTQTESDSTPPFVTPNSTIKDGAWSLWLSGNSTSAADGSTCGPSLRHLGLSNVAFVDGHVKAMRVEQWFYRMSPWTTQEGG